MASIRINFEKALKDYNKQMKKMVKKLKIEEEATIHKENSEHQRKLFSIWLKDHWPEYIEADKW